MPARLSQIKKALPAGFHLEKPKSGSHWKVVGAADSYPIPAHNGLKSNISDVYVRGLCRRFGWDYETFKARL